MATAATLAPTTFAKPQAPQPVAELRAVTKRFAAQSGGKAAAHTALDALSLTLHPGEIVALLGPNGAGKSTAVRCLLGLTTPISGQACVFGQDPRDPGNRTRIGAMLQVGAAPEMLTPREHLDLFRSYYPEPMPVDELVRIAGLERFLDKPFGALSGGQKQRTLFALALAGDPDLLFLDEPTVGMDIEARRSLWAAIRALAARGKTILLTTHYLEEADALASRIVVLAQGRVVQQGTPAEIKSASSGRTIRCTTALPLAALHSLPGVLDAQQTGNTVTLMATHPEALLRTLLTQDPTLANLEVLPAALEDAFLALTASPTP